MKTSLLYLFAVAAASNGFYSSNKNIYELNPKSFREVVHNTNYTSIVEFYAPWCGYCKQLEPVFNKMGKFINSEAHYAVNVAAINCDEEENKKLCADYKIQSFPTIMVFRPPKHQVGKARKGKHVPEQYNGARELGPLVEYASHRIKNYVKKIFSIDSEAFNNWINDSSDRHKVIVLTKSSMISPLLRSLAIDFLDTVSFAAVAAEGLTGPTTITLNDEEVEIPIKENESFPILLVYDRENNKFDRFKGKTLSKLPKIEKFITSKTGAKPSEGRLSAKSNKLAKLRGASQAHDEL